MSQHDEDVSAIQRLLSNPGFDRQDIVVGWLKWLLEVPTRVLTLDRRAKVRRLEAELQAKPAKKPVARPDNRPNGRKSQTRQVVKSLAPWLFDPTKLPKRPPGQV